MEPPILLKPIPAQVINERAAFHPFSLKDYIQAPEGSPQPIFQAEINDGRALPQGMICTGDGILTGIPAKDTHGNYELVITATNQAGSIHVPLVLTIKPSLVSDGTYADELKKQVWSALSQNLPLPDISEMLGREITPLDIYYLLERWAIVVMWDAFNLDPPGEKIELQLKGASEHYHVYDRGSCLIASPKDLYSHERTLLDGVRTAQAMANEVYNRKWTVELAGFDKLTRAAWVEFKRLENKYGRTIDIINYNPSTEDVKVYVNQSIERPEI